MRRRNEGGKDRPITEREIESEWSRVRAGGGPVTLTLKAGPPRGLVVKLSAKRAVFRYWFRVKGTGTKGLWELGDFPQLTLKDARDAALDVKKGTRRGVDPREAERQALRDAEAVKAAGLTLVDLLRRFVASRSIEYAPSTAKEYVRCIGRYFEPAPIGARPVREVRRIEVREFLDGIMRENGQGMARGLHRLLRTATRWGFDHELLDADPLAAVRMPRAEPRSRVLSDEELAAYWKALDAAPRLVAACLRLQALTAVRFPSELLTARWRDVDLGARRWSIPAEFRKGRQAHTCPLSDMAVRLLRSVERVTGQEERVFAPLTVRSQLDWSFKKASRAVRAEHKGQRFTPHDIRRSVASGLVRLGFATWPVADAVLGHGPKGTARVYITNAPMVDMAAALERWGRHVDQLVAGESKGADVVPMVRP